MIKFKGFERDSSRENAWMSNAKGKMSKPMVVGLEFERLTHWDRFVLNQNIAKMERQLFPEQEQLETEEDIDLWRGERRNFYRLNIQKMDFTISIEISASRGISLHDIPLINLSPAGCCVLLTEDVEFQPGFRIPRLTFNFPDESLTVRAKVVHAAVMDSSEEMEGRCF